MFKCKLCEQKDKEIVYLKTIVDNLLLNNGIQPVNAVASVEIPESEEEKEERARIEKGQIRYGDR